jgi:hypothetical protein
MNGLICHREVPESSTNELMDIELPQTMFVICEAYSKITPIVWTRGQDLSGMDIHDLTKITDGIGWVALNFHPSF